MSQVSVESDDLETLAANLKVASTWVTSTRRAKLDGYAEQLSALAKGDPADPPLLPPPPNTEGDKPDPF